MVANALFYFSHVQCCYVTCKSFILQINIYFSKLDPAAVPKVCTVMYFLVHVCTTHMQM